MTQYIKAYKNASHRLINLDFVKEIFTSSITVNNVPSKELVFIDNLGNVIFRFEGISEEYINDTLTKLEKFISVKEDTIFYLY